MYSHKIDMKNYVLRNGISAKSIPTLKRSAIALLVITLILVPWSGNQLAKAASESPYYVAPYGNNDNPGTLDEPWLTIQHAAQTLVAGDTVYVMEGTYNERVIPANSGSAGSWITYAAYPGHTVTIDGTGLTLYWWYGVFQITNQNYIKVSGFRVINSDWAGISAGGSCDHITIENCYTEATDGPGIYVRNTTNLVVDNNEVYNWGNELDHEGISIVGVNGFEIKYNYLHDGHKEGIDIKGDTSVGAVANGSLHHNTVTNCGNLGRGVGIYIDAPPAGAHDIDVYSNEVYGNSAQAMALDSEMGSTLSDINIYNNILYDSYHALFFGTGATSFTNIKIINNTFYKFNVQTILIPAGVGARFTNLIIRNNIHDNSAGSGYGIYFPDYDPANSDHIIDNNLFYQANSKYYGSDYVIGDPQFLNPPSEYSSNDFWIESNSPAIDAGSSDDAPSDDFGGNPRPQGAGYDIGAYEYAAGPVPPSAPEAEFSASPTSGIEPLSVQFSDESLADITSWSWAFGDGETSQEQNPSHTYTEAGSYTVSLTVTGPGGSNTETKADFIIVTAGNPGHLGDANQDGVVNTADITIVERIIAGLAAPTSGADTNQDGVVNTADITKIERIIAGLD